jgi:thymidylate kinase
MIEQFKRLQASYRFTMVDGHRTPDEISAELQKKIDKVLVSGS